MNVSIFARFPHPIGVGTIVALVCGLYFPFLGNPPIFDDAFLFSGQRFLYYATHPFGLELRVPPYFSFAVVQVLSGQMETHRIVSLAFHIACSLALYWGTQPQAATWACIGAAAFAVHPVAVYGAGYLVQRTIVLATLFSLLSLILFVRGLERRRQADAISAALMFSIAVLCKEHSVLLPAVAVLAVPLLSSDRRFGIRYAGLYLAACSPAPLSLALLAQRC